MKKQVKQFAQGHLAVEWKSLDSNPAAANSKVGHLLSSEFSEIFGCLLNQSEILRSVMHIVYQSILILGYNLVGSV